MSDRLEVLEERVRRLEEEVAALKGAAPSPAEGRLAGDEVPMLRRARQKQPAITAAAKEAWAAMGISGEPIPAEELQERIRNSPGWDPNDNWASRTITEEREE